MKKQNTCILLILLALSASPLASENQTTAELSDKKSQNGPLSFRFSLGSYIESSMHKLSDEVNGSLSNTTAMGLSFSHENGVKVGISLALDKDLRNDREENLRDIGVSVSKKLHTFSKTLSLSGILGTSIPSSENSQKGSSKLSSIRLTPVFSYDASYDVLENLSIIYRPSFAKQFHEFKTTTSGSSNTSYSASNRLIFAYSFNDKWSMAFDNNYIRSWKYNGQYNDLFSFDQSLSYSISDNFSTSIGHAIGGSALAVNGQESDVRLFDSEASAVYFGIDFAY